MSVLSGVIDGFGTRILLAIEGPSITGQAATPSKNFLPSTIIVSPVGVAPDAPQKANLPTTIVNAFSLSSFGFLTNTKTLAKSNNDKTRIMIFCFITLN